MWRFGRKAKTKCISSRVSGEPPYLLSIIFYLLSIPAYTRPTYLLYHKQHVLFNPEYAQILHSKIVGSANRRNTKAVI